MGRATGEKPVASQDLIKERGEGSGRCHGGNKAPSASSLKSQQGPGALLQGNITRRRRALA